LKDDTAYARFNKKVAIGLTKYIGTMTAFWVFCVISVCSLPAVLTLVIPSLTTVFPHWLIATSLVALVAWISSNFIQLVLLPALMVGQNLQSVAADARADKTFEDVETIISQLDVKTQGGLGDIYQILLDRLPHPAKK
jgi:hypothetical protein